MTRKNIINNFLTILILTTLIYTSKGQDLKSTLIEYLIKVGDLDQINDIKKYYGDIYVLDLLKYEDISIKKKGVFKFGTFSDHSKTYLLLNDDNFFEILDMQELDDILIKEIDFLKKNKKSSDEILKYIEATIVEYKKCLKAIPWTD